MQNCYQQIVGADFRRCDLTVTALNHRLRVVYTPTMLVIKCTCGTNETHVLRLDVGHN